MSVQSKFNALELLTRIRAANALIPDAQPSGDSIQAFRNPESHTNRKNEAVRKQTVDEVVVDSKIYLPLVGQSSSQNRSPSNISGVSNAENMSERLSPPRNVTKANDDYSKKYGSSQQSLTVGTSSPAAGEGVNENRRINVFDQSSFLSLPVRDHVVMRYKDTYNLDDDRNVRNRRERTGYDSLNQYNQDVSQNIPDYKNQIQKVKNNNLDLNKQSVKSDLSYEECFSPINNNFDKNRSNPMTPSYTTSSDADTVPYNTPYSIPFDYSDIKSNSPIAAEIYEELNKLRLDNSSLNRKIRMLTIQKSEIERRNREAKMKNDDIIATLRCT